MDLVEAVGDADDLRLERDLRRPSGRRDSRCRPSARDASARSGTNCRKVVIGSRIDAPMRV